MKKILGGLLLLLAFMAINEHAHAADLTQVAGMSQEGFSFSSIVKNFDGWETIKGGANSTLMLGHIYGDWVYQLSAYAGFIPDEIASQAKTDTPITVVGGLFNVVAAFIIAIVAFWTIVWGVMKTAQSGEFLGGQQKWDFSSIFLRTAICIVMLQPTPMSPNVSYIQAFGMWGIIQGAETANYAASAGIDRIGEMGGASNGTKQLLGFKHAVDISTNVMCAKYFEHHNVIESVGEVYAYDNETGTVKWMKGGSPTPHVARYVYTDKHLLDLKTRNIPGPMTGNALDMGNVNNLVKIEWGEKGVCGQTNFGRYTKMYQERNEDKIRGINQWKILTIEYANDVSAMFSVFEEFHKIRGKSTDLPNIDSIKRVAQTQGNDLAIKEKLNQMKVALAWAVRTYKYVNDLDVVVGDVLVNDGKSDAEKKQTLLNDLYGESGDSTFSSIMKSAKSDGWNSLGAYFLKLGEVSTMKSEIAQLVTSATTVNEIPKTCTYSRKNWKLQKREECSIAQMEMAYEAVTYLMAIGINELASANPGDQNLDLARLSLRCPTASSATCPSPETRLNDMDKMGSQYLSSFIEDYGNFTDGGYKSETKDGLVFENPYVKANNFGNGLMNLSQAIKIIKITAAFATGVADANFLTGTATGFGGGAKAVFDVMAPSIQATEDTTMRFGSFLVYAPGFMAALAWGFGVCAWLLLSVEVFLGAPFAMMLMAQPEGEGITGANMQKVIGLFVLAIIYPLLLVAAFFFSLAYAEVCYGVWNQLYWTNARLNYGNGLHDFLNTFIYFWIGFAIFLMLPIQSWGVIARMVGGWATSVNSSEAANTGSNEMKEGQNATNSASDLVTTGSRTAPAPDRGNRNQDDDQHQKARMSRGI